MTTSHFFDQIDAYLRMELTAEQELAFEQAMANDAELALQVELHRMTLDAIRHQTGQEKRRRLKSIREKTPPSPAPAMAPWKNMKPYAWLILVAGALGIGALIWFLIPRNTINPSTQPSQNPMAQSTDAHPSQTTAPEAKNDVASPPVDTGRWDMLQKQISGLSAAGKYPRAIDSSIKLLKNLESAGQKNSPVYQQTKEELAELYWKNRQYREARNTGKKIPEEQVEAAENLEGLMASAEKEDNSMGSRGSADAHHHFFNSGEKAFYSKPRNNLAVIKNLEKITPQDPDYVAAQYMLAIVFFQERRFAQAATCFEKYAALDNSIDTQWQLAMFYLADIAGHRSELIAKLEEIIQRGDPEIAPKARQLLSKLQNKRSFFRPTSVPERNY